MVSHPILGVSYRIVSASILLGKTHIACITADSAADNRSHYTGDQRTLAPRPVTAERARRTIREEVGGAGGGRRL